MIWLYVGLVALLNMPPVKEAVAGRVASLLSDFLDTEVRIGSIGLGFLNTATVDDLYVEDRQGRELLKAARVSATINLRDLSTGEITLEGVQLFSVDAHLRKETPESRSNFQFIVDAFSSDNEEKTPLRLKLSSIILRHANVSYDVESEPLTPGRFNTSHINITDAALTAAMTIREGETLSCVIRRMDGTETNSGLSLKRLSLTAKAETDGASASKIRIESNAMSLTVDSATVKYQDWGKGNDGRWTLATRINNSRITPSVLKCFVPSLKELKTEMNLRANITGGTDGWTVNNMRLTSDRRSILLNMDAAYHPGETSSDTRISCNIDTLWAKAATWNEIVRTASIDDSTATVIHRLGNIGMKGKFKKDRSGAAANARVTTECGHVAMQLGRQSAYTLDLTGTNINIGKILNDSRLGITSLTMKADGKWDRKNDSIPQGNLAGTVHTFQYAGYTYNDISVSATSNGNSCTAAAHIADPNLRMRLNGRYAVNTNRPAYSLRLNLNDFNPHALNLTEEYEQESFDLRMAADINGNNPDDMTGSVRLDSIRIFTPEAIYMTDSVVLISRPLPNVGRHITLNGDFIEAEIKGDTDYKRIKNTILNQLAYHLPALFKPEQTIAKGNNFEYDFTIRESAMVKHLLKKDYNIHKPINLYGRLDNRHNIMDLYLQSERLEYDGTAYRNLRISTKQTPDRLSLSAGLSREEAQGLTHMNLLAKAVHNNLDTQVAWESDNTKDTYKGYVDATTTMSDSTGRLNANITFKPSEISIKDTTWTIQPSRVSILDNKFTLYNFEVSHKNLHLTANGTVSNNDNDSLNIDILGIPVEYLQDLANFHPVRFMGRLSGKATLKSLYSDTPQFDAALQIAGMHLQRGLMGDADLHVQQNSNTKGIEIKGIIIDSKDSHTGIDGYVSTKDKQIDLLIATHNTNAAFLNGFIGSIFEDIEGKVNCDLRVCGPLGDIGLEGNVAANVDMTLRPTKVRYRIEGDTLRFRPYRFNFDNIAIRDEHNNRGTVNGHVGHKNLKNFSYDINVGMQHLLCYDETEFNSDKFFATVFADGDIRIMGADRQPLRINGNVSTGRGSVFAYDAATPDAISSSNFITFRDRNAKRDTPITDITSTQSTTSARQNTYQYSGDIHMNLNIALNNNCEIKLRMDNTEDGYMSTYGHGNLQAIYHNKSPFALHGTYNIDRGSYRLFLQDLIYRDLAIQSGSNVDFAGDPFAAELHLICHHTLNSVPLSDLTASTAYSYNNKVKVICILDITGTLASMDFTFDLDLPNVNEETKQLVRSMINSEEERNTQIIYLLGLGRFYPNEYARAANEDTNSSAMSSLLSSTLSGQINQMLSNAMGKDSKWNFGTGLTTGENGWEDLDVEGILSGRLLNDRLLINGNFGYRDNSITQTSNFIGDFDVRWKITETGNTYIKAYNQSNDRYFTKATLNTQGIGISYERAFEKWTDLFRFNRKKRDNTLNH